MMRRDPGAMENLRALVGSDVADNLGAFRELAPGSERIAS